MLYCGVSIGPRWKTATGGRIIDLLNQYKDIEATREAVRLLHASFLHGLDSVDVTFDTCNDWNRRRTARTAGRIIHICEDIRTDAFQREKPQYPIPEGMYVTHYAAVVLHEFGHVLLRRGLIKDNGEDAADQWAREETKRLIKG